MRRTPVMVPATAPVGGRSRKPSSGQTSPRTTVTPDRSRKPSTATPAPVVDDSRRTSGWTTRPSLMGVMAANRFSMAMLRKLRSSTSGSKRGSTCGERSEPPPPNLEPTYRLEPKNRFKPSVVEEIIRNTLEDNLKDRSYRPKVSTLLCRKITDELRDKVKRLGYDRYRCVANVIICENKDQGVMASSRCAWDDKRDSYASHTFQAKDFFCTASVYGVYKE